MRPGAKFLARGAASAAAVCFALAALAPAAKGDANALAIYDGASVGQGVVASFAVRPSIFDPLAQAGSPYTSAKVSSQGNGAAQSLAGQIFPGWFGVGAVGCGGLAGWVQAKFPATPGANGKGCDSDQDEILFKTPHSEFFGSLGHPEVDAVVNTLLDRSSYVVGKIHAHALLGVSSATVRTIDYILRSDPSLPPVIEIGDISLASSGTRTDTRITGDVSVIAKDVSIMNGLITIGAISSVAGTTSDGSTGTAHAKLTLSDVNVTIAGASHRAVIDDHGIRLTGDPGFSRDQTLGFQEQLDETLVHAGVKIIAAHPQELVEGPRSQASVEGLDIIVYGSIPVVPIPRELAPILGPIIHQIPTKCVNEVVPESVHEIPLCAGAGVLPGSGNDVAITLNIASADSFSVGGAGYSYGGSYGGCSACGGSNYQPPGDVSFPQPQPVPGTQPVVDSARPPVTQQPGPLLGIFARLPSAGLAFAGAALLFLAVGAAMGPSLRHERAG